MAETNNKSAKLVYQTLCEALDERGWNYEKEEDKLLVHFSVRGDDLPMNFIIFVDEKRDILRLMSPMDYKFPEDKRVEGACAACIASFGMANGNFDYDLSNGRVSFRINTYFKGSLLSKNLIKYMIDCACAMVDHYNDKFFMLGKGMLSLADFIEKENA